MPTVKEVMQKCEAAGLEIRRNVAGGSHTKWDIVDPSTGVILTGISGSADRQGGDPNWYNEIRRQLRRAGFDIRFGKERKKKGNLLTRNPRSKIAGIAVDLEALRIAQEKAAAAGERIPTLEDLQEHPEFYKRALTMGSQRIYTDAATEEIIQNMAPGADASRVNYTIGRLTSFMERKGPELDERAKQRLIAAGKRATTSKGRNSEFVRIAMEEVAPARDLQAWKSLESGIQTLGNLLTRGGGASIWTLNLIEATMDHLDGLKYNYVDEARKGQKIVAERQKKEQSAPKPEKPAEEEIPPAGEEAQVPLMVEKETYDLAQQLIEEHEEIFRQIAMVAGADGTLPDDWRACVDKPKAALDAVDSLRKDYQTVNLEYSELSRKSEKFVDPTRELVATVETPSEVAIKEEYARALFGMLEKFDPKNADQYVAIFDRLDKLAGIS